MIIPYDKLAKEYEEYFKELERKVKEAFRIAEEARKRGLDPSNEVEIKIARDMLDRVIEIVSLMVPELKNVNFDIRERIRKYENEYGSLDWRVAMKIGEDVAKAIYEMKGDKRYAIEAGLRIAEAYATLGIVAAPIEGIAKVEIKKRRDGKDYLAVYAAGPIRAAGGTAAAIIALFADYLRKVFGLETWDPTEEEIQRYVLEVFEYDRIKKLQYRPSRRELEFLFRHLPVEVSGEPTEDKEVSNYKDLPRIETNRIRGGMALVVAEGICQKAKKIWKKLKKWGKDFGLEHWSWLEEFLKIQEEEKAKGITSEENKESEKKSNEKIKPNWKYLEEIAAGRAVLALPMAKGGFRLRYGKSRINGFETVSIHPATAILLFDFVAVGTQIRPERPGKSAGITFCETIEPPVVKLKDGSVIRVKTVKKAKEIRNKVEKILFLGDMLVNFGIISNNLDSLLPVGYCEEWWILEFEKKAMEKIEGFKVHFDLHKPRELFEIEGLEKLAKYLGIAKSKLEKYIRYPLKKKPRIEEALKISLLLDVPLHPKYTYHWKDIRAEDVITLLEWIKNAKKEYKKKIKVGEKEINICAKIVGDYKEDVKTILENLLVIHRIEDNKIVIDYPDSTALLAQLGLLLKEDVDIPEGEYENGLDVVQRIADVKIRDKVGIYIGARVGRPEKAKMRKMKGRPHMLFPVGEEGGRMRNFNEALKMGKITAELPLFYCENCKRYTLYPNCEFCGSKTIQLYQCPRCKKITKLTRCPDCDIPTKPYAKRTINPKEYLELAIKTLGISASEVPQILKGVRGLSNAKKVPERLEKGILRAKYGLHVFRDGTIRFDSIELPIFYFRPKDLLYTSIEKLKELGYTHDIYGRPLESEDQILELKPQDVILPAGGENFAKLLVKVAQFVDEELQRLYGLKPYYNVKKPEDLIGHLGIAIAPHISAGTVVRIIGFSKTQAYFAHPLLHASCRRNCLHPSEHVIIRDSEGIKVLSIKEIFEKYKPGEIEVLNFDNCKISWKKVLDFVKLEAPDRLIKIRTEYGREILVTPDHKFIVYNGGDFIEKRASEIQQGDLLIIPTHIPFDEDKKVEYLYTYRYFLDKSDYRAHGLKDIIKRKLNEKSISVTDFLKEIGIGHSYYQKDSIPTSALHKIQEKLELDLDNIEFYITYRKKYIGIPSRIKLDYWFGFLIGLYIADGFARQNDRLSHVSIAISGAEKEIVDKILEISEKIFKYKPAVEYRREDDIYIITFSGKPTYDLFVNILKVGRNAREKRIPWQAFNNPEFAAGIIAGIIAGDGSITDREVSITTVNLDLVSQLVYLLLMFNIVASITKENRIYKNERYIEYKVRIYSIEDIKKLPIKPIGLKLKKLDKFTWKVGSKRRSKDYMLVKVTSVEEVENDAEFVYDFVVEGNKVFLGGKGGIFSIDCDGDELSFILLLDALLNFSKEYLPKKRGGRMDAPLVLTVKVVASEVDDEVHKYETVWNYPLEFYEAAQRYAPLDEIKLETVADRLGKPEQYFDWGFMHDVRSINYGNKISMYKRLKSMSDKLLWMIKVAEIVRASDPAITAKVVIEGHFARDVKGNLRKFSTQVFRCVKCNEKYRRVPLSGKCLKCGGRIVFTVSEGTVKKYLGISLWLAEKVDLDNYTKQTLETLKARVDQTFGKPNEKQVDLTRWFKK